MNIKKVAWTYAGYAHASACVSGLTRDTIFGTLCIMKRPFCMFKKRKILKDFVKSI